MDTGSAKVQYKQKISSSSPLRSHLSSARVIDILLSRRHAGPLVVISNDFIMIISADNRCRRSGWIRRYWRFQVRGHHSMEMRWRRTEMRYQKWLLSRSFFNHPRGALEKTLKLLSTFFRSLWLPDPIPTHIHALLGNGANFPQFKSILIFSELLERVVKETVKFFAPD